MGIGFQTLQRTHLKWLNIYVIIYTAENRKKPVVQKKKEMVAWSIDRRHDGMLFLSHTLITKQPSSPSSVLSDPTSEPIHCFQLCF